MQKQLRIKFILLKKKQKKKTLNNKKLSTIEKKIMHITKTKDD